MITLPSLHYFFRKLASSIFLFHYFSFWFFSLYFFSCSFFISSKYFIPSIYFYFISFSRVDFIITLIFFSSFNSSFSWLAFSSITISSSITHYLISVLSISLNHSWWAENLSNCSPIFFFTRAVTYLSTYPLNFSLGGFKMNFYSSKFLSSILSISLVPLSLIKFLLSS